MSSLAATIGCDGEKCTMWYMHAGNWGLRENVGIGSGWCVVVALHGQRKAAEVETRSGRRPPCDVVVVCAGVDPATRFLKGSGIALEKGDVAVDELLQTNVPNVWAAGDVTSFRDPVFTRRSDEPSSRDYDFSKTAIQANLAQGYAEVTVVLGPISNASDGVVVRLGDSDESVTGDVPDGVMP